MQFHTQEIQKANWQVAQKQRAFVQAQVPTPIGFHTPMLNQSDIQSLKQLSGSALISEVKNLAREERRVTHEILLRIQEVERRKLHLDLGFPSILDWLVKDIGYSESAAYRRMQAARLLVAVPDTGEKLKSGEVSLSTLAKVQSVVKQEEKRTQAKIENSFKAELIGQLESKSTREAEKILVQTFPESAPSTSESLRAVSNEESRLSIILDDEVRRDLERAKELFSHIKHDMTWAEVIAQALKIALDHKDPLRKKTVSRDRVLKAQQDKHAQNAKPLPSSKEQQAIAQGSTGAGGRFMRQPQPAQLRRYILQRDQGSCQYRNPSSGQICGSRHQIEIDHIIPVALGGTNDVANLRCLCRRHNLARAERQFGFVYR